jgi:hypothetical protein
MKKLLLSLVVLLALSVNTFAHVWELRMCSSNTGQVTLYGQVWHPVGDCIPATGSDGLTVNGTYHDWDYTTWTAGSLVGVCATVICTDPAPQGAANGYCADSRCSWVSMNLGFISPGTALTIQTQGITVCFTASQALLTACTGATVPNFAPCGKNGNKVELCHQTGSTTNPNTQICIDPVDVADHLAHGDTYGPCPANKLAGYTVENISVHPNPNGGIFTVNLGNSDLLTSVRVIDFMGKLVYDNSTTGSSVTVDLSNLGTGLYFVEVSNSKENFRSKVQVQ